MAYASISFTFGEIPSAAKWNILGTNDASFNDGTGIADGVIKPEHLKNGSSTLNTWAWDTWTPTLSGRLNDSKWTKACKYIQIGKTVFYRLSLVANAATPMDGGTAEAIFTLPVTSISYPGTATAQNIGISRLFRGSAFHGRVEWATTTTAQIRVDNVAGTYLTPNALTSAVPGTWASADEIYAQGFYEAA